MMFRHRANNFFFFKKNLVNFVSLKRDINKVQSYGGKYDAKRHIADKAIILLTPTNLCFWED